MSTENFDDLIALRDLPKVLPKRRGGARLNLSTVWRWRLHGIRGVKLQTLCIGGIPYTKRAWLDEFFSAADAASRGEQPTPATRAPARRQRECAQAEARLTAVGIE